jgi:arylsulfatase
VSRKLITILALALPVLSCGSPTAPARGADVVVCVLDALSAGRVGCYGDSAAKSPFLDTFAAGALRFEQAHASASYTLASTASLFTGRAPLAHRTLGDKSNIMPFGMPTLAEALREAGYRTAGVSCNPHVAPEAGFGRGFDSFTYHPRDRMDRLAVPASALEDARAFWSDAEGAPRFLYLHLLPPHAPYDPPGELGEVAGTERRDGLQDTLRAINEERRALAPFDPRVERALSRYHAGLTYVDGVLGELLADLGVLDDEGAVIAILSDHGEAFAEHGRILHGSTVHVEMTRVPLLLRAPGMGSGAIPRLARTRDLAATVCELVGAHWIEGVGGWSMLSALRGEVHEPPEPVVSRTTGSRPFWSFRTERWTLLRHPGTDRSHLYDAWLDPAERTDLAVEEPELVADLLRRFDERMDADRASAAKLQPAGSTNAHRADLEAIGHAGGDE